MKIVLLFAVALILAAPFSIAQNSGGDDHIEIVIGEGGVSGGPEIRIPVWIPIEASYSPSLSCLELSFSDNLGAVTVRIENLTTGANFQTVINAVQGSHYLPITGDAGVYELSFTLLDGHIYIGVFEIELS